MMPSLPSAASAETAELFEQHGPAVYRFARVMLHHTEDAEDVVQTVFIRLFQHLERGGDRTNLRAWLFTVTANLARDALRTRNRWLPWRTEGGESADPNLDVRDPELQFLVVLRELAPRDRLLLALRAQGLSYREIAEAADMPPASVGQSLSRALARWRRARELTAIA